MIALVIDASVARSASNRSGAGHPSPRCKETLEQVRRGEFTVATSRAIQDEWKRHATPFAWTWLKELVGRKRVRFFANPQWDHGADVLAAAEERLGSSKAVRKDLPLVECAMAADRRVVSNDADQRRKLARLVGDVPALAGLCWVSAADEPGALEWLAEGAPATDPWTIGTT